MIKAPIKKKKQTELVEYKVTGDSVFVAGKLIGFVQYDDTERQWVSIRKIGSQQLKVGKSAAKHVAAETCVKAHMYNWLKFGGGR